MVGRSLKHYRIIEKVGEGGMGVVYKANDTHLNRLVAIKVLPSDGVSDEGRRKRFVQEARAASALEHPNIVTIHDVDQQDGHYFIVMEYVAGQTLTERIGRKGLRRKEALHYAVQIADALAQAHAAGIIHRDLKPSNIIVGSDGRVKILDFGLAKLTAPPQSVEQSSTVTFPPATEEGMVVGTAPYMSPEQVDGRTLDARSDLFSFGSVLYEMVTGRRAFQRSSPLSTMAAILSDDPEPPRQVAQDLSHDFEKLILKCLRKDPDSRWQAAADLRVALRDLQDETASHTAPAVAGYKTRWRWPVAVLALALLFPAAWHFWQRDPQGLPEPRLVQLTSYPGSEWNPSFSPNGEQVAFAWDGGKGNADIYVKMLGEANALRLTTDPSWDQSPVWSSDGRRIAFQRLSPGGRRAVYIVSALGGPEQRLAEFAADGQMSWSPDGKMLAAGRYGSGIFLLPESGGEPMPVSRPKEPAYDRDPAFSPDGRSIAYASCAGPLSCEVTIQRLGQDYKPAGPPNPITRQGHTIRGISWSRDAESVVYSSSPVQSELSRIWQAWTSGAKPPRRIELAGFPASEPSIARAGGRLAFTRRGEDNDVWRFKVGGAPEPFLVSLLTDNGAQFSPDGSRVVFQSTRSGEAFEIWLANADGSNPVPLIRNLGRHAGSPDWSPDGKWIAVDVQGQDGRYDIHIAEAAGGQPRRITTNTADEFLPTFSKDGKRIYFSSNRTGNREIWWIPSGGGREEQLTSEGGFSAREAIDGKTVFYTKAIQSPLFARDRNRGPERTVLDYVYWRAFVPVEDGVYFIGRPDSAHRHSLQFFQFATGATSHLVTLDGPLQWGLTVSPDRKTFLYTRSRNAGNDLMMIENFR